MESYLFFRMLYRQSRYFDGRHCSSSWYQHKPVRMAKKYSVMINALTESATCYLHSDKRARVYFGQANSVY